MSNSPLISYTRLSECFGNYDGYGNKTPGRAGGRISKITIHHTAGVSSVEGLGEVFAPLSRGGSANYGIGNDGRIGMYVEEKNRAWTSSSAENDNTAVTIEVSNDKVGGDWTVGEAAMRSLIALCADICRRNGIPRLNYTGDKSGNLTMHKWFAATACPGPYLESKFPYIADAVNNILKESDEMTDTEKKEFAALKDKVASVGDAVASLNKELSSLKGELGRISERLSSADPGQRSLTKTVETLSSETLPRWDRVEDVPDWGRASVEKLVSDGSLLGEGGKLGISRLMLRLIVLIDRLGLGA